MVAALVVAGAISAVLAIVVLGPLASRSHDAGRTPVSLAAAVATTAAEPTAEPASNTPTPPVSQPTTAPPAAQPTSAPADAPQAPTTAPPPTVPPPTATAAPTATPAPTSTPMPTPPPTVAALYAADAGGGLEDWALAPSWALEDGELVNDATGVKAQPWLVAPYEPDGDAYAVEAEILFEELAGRTCDQNFGVVGGGGGGVVWGGGVRWGCDGDGPRARITDVSVWADGFNQDRELDGTPFNPGTDWHTYRLEVRGSDLRLLVDGDLLLEASDGAGTGEGGQIGLWSQGVALTVRRVAVIGLAT